MITTLTATVIPHEAQKLPSIPDTPEINDALVALATACNGCMYMGSDIEAQLRAIRFLRSRPDIAQALGVGVA